MTAQLWDKVANQVNFNLEIDVQRFCHLVKPDAKILDFGCGYGRIAKQLKQLGYPEVLGVDPSAAMIKRGLSLYPDIDLIQLPQLPLPFADETFDVVLSCAVLTCMPSEMAQKAAILELKRVLKPGGLFHLSEFCAPMTKRFTSGWVLLCVTTRPCSCRSCWKTLSTWRMKSRPVELWPAIRLSAIEPLPENRNRL